jgi:hypothetical protein
MENTGKAGQIGAYKALISGQFFEGLGGGLKQTLVSEPGVRATKSPQGLGDGEGDEEMGTWHLFVELVLKPELGVVMLTLRTMPIAASMIDAMRLATTWAGVEAVAIGASSTSTDGPDGFEMCRRQVGVAVDVLRGISVEDGSHRDHGCTARITELMRSTASSWPFWVRWR